MNSLSTVSSRLKLNKKKTGQPKFELGFPIANYKSIVKQALIFYLNLISQQYLKTEESLFLNVPGVQLELWNIARFQ
jgi:hypothetical protein